MRLDGYISLSGATLWYNWPNISRELDNNSIIYTTPEGVEVSVTFPDGSYSVTDLSNFLHHFMDQKGHLAPGGANVSRTSDARYAISFYANPTYNRVTLKISPGYTIKVDALARVLGAEPHTVYTNSVNFPHVPQLENVKSVLVHCNLVYNEYQSDSSLLYNFTPNERYGSLLSIEPRFPQWRKTRETSENTIEVWLTNQDGVALQLEDEWGIIMQVADKELIRI